MIKIQFCCLVAPLKTFCTFKNMRNKNYDDDVERGAVGGVGLGRMFVQIGL